MKLFHFHMQNMWTEQNKKNWATHICMSTHIPQHECICMQIHLCQVFVYPYNDNNLTFQSDTIAMATN